MSGEPDGGSPPAADFARIARAPLWARLYASGHRFVVAALTAYTRQERDMFALHAGVAVEHLAKARLTAINPLLILDPTRCSDDAILWLAEEPNRDPRPPQGLVTIGGARALKLLGRRVVMSKAMTDVLDLLRDQRNGIGHLGHADLDNAADHLPAILEAVLVLAEGLSDEPREVFGVHRQFAAIQRADWIEAEERELAGRKVAAERMLEEKHPHLTDDLRAALTHAITETLEDSRHEGYQIAACPVCGFPARVDGELYLDYDVSVDDEGSVSGGALGVFDATSLRCPTCDLVLDSPSLVKRSGAMDGFQVPWEDVTPGGEVPQRPERVVFTGARAIAA